MIEANENIDLVTLRRQAALEASQREAQEVLAQTYTATVNDSSTSTAPAGALAPETQALQTVQTQETETPKENTDFRQTRLAITAGLVVLLIVLWILQKRASRR